MLLHKDTDLFREVVISTADILKIAVPIVEKDYYVTMILKELSEANIECVFKGGTSLSKCYHVIDRFSEDIDISFSDKLTQGMRKKLKNSTIKGISKKLSMPIIDWEQTRSRRDYNCYTFSYHPVERYEVNDKLYLTGVKMEVALGSIAFPTEKLKVDSYAYRFLQKDNKEIISQYGLEPFYRNVQRMDRTLIDKVFVLCDYYMQGKTKRYSRHIYDIYMLLPYVNQDEDLKSLVREVRSCFWQRIMI